ncbi:unnamed protein product [Dicrocoelium dendriticum]|nr:unnamed protein product [Dicrocoelium dendriticum]
MNYLIGRFRRGQTSKVKPNRLQFKCSECSSNECSGKKRLVCRLSLYSLSSFVPDSLSLLSLPKKQTNRNVMLKPLGDLGGVLVESKDVGNPMQLDTDALVETVQARVHAPTFPVFRRQNRASRS